MGSQVAIVVMLAGMAILAAGGCTEAGPRQATTLPNATGTPGSVSSSATHLRLIHDQYSHGAIDTRKRAARQTARRLSVASAS